MINIPKLDKIASLYLERLILPSDPLRPMWNRENFIFQKPAKWNYIDSALIRGLLLMYEFSGDKRLLSYAEDFTDAYVTDEGEIPTLRHSDFNMDNINGGKNLISLYRLTRNEKYRLAYESLYSELMKYPRLSCGNFYHKAIYPHQLWLDGSFMALPFMLDYAIITGEKSPAEDVLNQLENITKLMHDSETGLYYHGYDESRSDVWADSETGLSHEFWLRAMGWYCAALADLCELSADFPEIRRHCTNALSEILEALSQRITEENMLLQLPDKPELSGNYPETSGTLLCAYAALKFCRLGFGTEKNKTDGVKMLSAVAENYIDLSGEVPVLKNICLMAGLGGEKRRNGRAEYYLSEPIVENDAKGIAPFLMAYTELKRLASQETHCHSSKSTR